MLLSLLSLVSTVTRITQQKDKNRVNIYLDGEFAFGISLESLVKHGLKVGAHLDPQTVLRLAQEGQEGKVYAKAVRFATLRPRSRKEIEDWFGRKKTDKETEKVVFGRLERLGLVDDRAFAAWWVQQRITFRAFSRRLLKLELARKGIAGEIIDEVLEKEEIPDEIELAKTALRRKFKSISGLSDQQLRRIYGFLGRRGFSWTSVKRAIDEVAEKE